MSRVRIDPPGGVHHVMNRGVNRNTVFFDDDARLAFGAQLAAVHDKFGAEVLAYCLMGNHFHLLLRTEPGTLSPTMQHLSSRFTRETNRRLGRDGPLFRGRFHAIPVMTDGYLMAATRYVHRNPLDLPTVTSLEQYRWSSYRTYLGLREPPSFMSTDPIAGMIGREPHEVVAFHRPSGCLDVMGDSGNVSASSVRQLIDLGIGLSALADPERQVSPQLGRTIEQLVDEVPGVSADVVAELRGESTSSNAARLARRRARARRAADPMIDEVLAFLARQLTPESGRPGSVDVRPEPTRSL